MQSEIILPCQLDDDHKYTLLEKLGEGSTATVYKAVSKAGQTFAIKVLDKGLN